MINIDFNDINSIENSKFNGFVPFCELLNSRQPPESNGVYMILLKRASKPLFLIKGTGGYFKDKEPNVSIAELEANWIDNTIVVYIGKASNLKRRLSYYRRFGEGKKVSHYGGRYIWQIKNAMSDLIVCWKTTIGEDEDKIESDLISDFRVQYGVRPFANLNK